MRTVVGVAIVGAGPYGLSVAAHLAAYGLKPRVFGAAMDTWLRRMPQGMVLKSEGFAMNLSDPAGHATLGAFCAERGIPYQDIGWPVPVETFAAYGLDFQKKLVPQLEETNVTAIIRVHDGFALTLATGEQFVARNVVMATGIRPYSRMPAELRDLPQARATHSADIGDMTPFSGQHVAVLGGGASAMDVAASLHRAGAQATVITRRAAVRFYSPSSFRSVRDRLTAPMTSLGPGWKKYLCVTVPGAFRVLPRNWRSRILQRYLGPSPAWSVRSIIENHVALRLRSTLLGARSEADGVVLTVADATDAVTTLRVDHVIAATGYAIDIERLAILDPEIRTALRCHADTPLLSGSFETSMRSLFFVGTPSAASFGPMLRFVCGTGYTARRVASRIAAHEAAVAGSARRAGHRLVPAWHPTPNSISS